MILSIETATDICSVSFQDASGEVHEKRITRKGSHSEYLFTFVRELMKEHNFKLAELHALLVSNGPGSYTGLRIAASAVKGLLFGTDVKVFAANTLAGFAFGAKTAIQSAKQETLRDTPNIHAVINARRSHLYYQKFTLLQNALQAQCEASVLEIEEIEKNLQQDDIIIGTGTERLKNALTEKCSVFGLDHVSANHLIKLYQSKNADLFFRQTTAEELESNYISSSQINNSPIN